MCRCTYILHFCCRVIVVAICFKMVCSVNLTLFSHMKGNSLWLSQDMLCWPHWHLLLCVHTGGMETLTACGETNGFSVLCLACLWSFVLACLRCECGGKLELSLYLEFLCFWSCKIHDRVGGTVVGWCCHHCTVWHVDVVTKSKVCKCQKQGTATNSGIITCFFILYRGSFNFLIVVTTFMDLSTFNFLFFWSL